MFITKKIKPPHCLPSQDVRNAQGYGLSLVEGGLFVSLFVWLMIAFITWDSNSVPLLKGLCSSILYKFVFSGF